MPNKKYIVEISENFTKLQVIEKGKTCTILLKPCKNATVASVVKDMGIDSTLYSVTEYKPPFKC